MGTGAQVDLFRYTEFPEKKSKTICLGSVVQNKRQFLFQEIQNVDIVGPVIDDVGFKRGPNYKGIWNRRQVQSGLTSYGNLVCADMYTKGTPLVIKEALVAGLGIVCTANCTHELDLNQPFIDIIPDNIMGDKKLMSEFLDMNRKISTSMRRDIREYGISNFGWEPYINDYEELITNLVKENGKTKDTKTTT